MVRKVRRASVSIYAIRPPQRAADETRIAAACLLVCLLLSSMRGFSNYALLYESVHEVGFLTICARLLIGVNA